MDKSYIRNPIHGGKITCFKCGGFFVEQLDVPIEYSPGVYFHEGCFNPHERYFGVDDDGKIIY